jgi:peptidoglycan/LPS O-acetylase OafA/YrhL
MTHEKAVESSDLVLPPTTSAVPLLPVSARLAEIDGMRALAILMIFTYHVWLFSDSPGLGGIGRVINEFAAGVDLFMVLSGFCLFWPVCKTADGLRRWSCRDYARRRARRIIPPYYAAIAYVTVLPFVLVMIYRAFGQHGQWQTSPGIWQLATHLLFIHTLFPSTWNGIQGAFWSLGLEAEFYVMFPFIVMGYRKLGIAVVWPVVVASLLYRVAAASLLKHSEWTTRFLASIFFMGRWMEFAAGMLVAWIVARMQQRRLWSAWTGTALLLFSAMIYVVGAAGFIRYFQILPVREILLATAFGLLIVTLCVTRTHARPLFANRITVGLGFISYSVFLIHQTTVYYLGELLKKVMHLGGPSRFACVMTGGLPLIVAVSYVFFRLFEKPFLGGSQRWKSNVAEPRTDV